jgi:hypothetical protein
MRRQGRCLSHSDSITASCTDMKDYSNGNAFFPVRQSVRSSIEDNASQVRTVK